VTFLNDTTGGQNKLGIMVRMTTTFAVWRVIVTGLRRISRRALFSPPGLRGAGSEKEGTPSITRVGDHPTV
jgi:hypothetical protein